jgi:mono/diheme cytochrome c family protein
MNMPIRVLVLSALVCMGVSGCQPAGKEAGKDTNESQVQAPAESVMKPVEPVPEPATAAEPQAKPAPQGQTKEAGPLKIKAGQTAQVAAAAATARADSIKQAQEKAEATRIARLDSLKRAEAARAAARTEAVVPRVEAVAPAGAGQVAQGKAPYEENCRKCHGVRGVPPKTMQAKFPKIATFDAAFFAKRSDDSVVTILTKGKNQDMKSFKDKLSHAQMVAVAAYIRSFSQ